MRKSTYRARRRASFKRDAGNPQMEHQQEQKFFGSEGHAPFFQPGASIQRSAEDETIHRAEEKAPEKEKEKEKVNRAAEPEKKEEEKKVARAAEPEKKEEKVQRAAEPEKKEEEKKVQKKESDTAPGTGVTTAQYIDSIDSRGQPMPAKEQSFFGKKMGYDFSRVRIHTGRDAAESARDVSARAYTYGRHIVFNDGQYNTESQDGRTLLAHELTHVVQQGATPDDSSEREALAMATESTARHRVQIQQHATSIQCDARTGGVDVLGMSSDVGELNEKVTKLIELQESLRKAAEIIRHGKGDKSLAEATGNLLSAADNLTNVVHIYQEFTDQFHHLPAEEINKRIHEAAKAVQWLDAASKLHDRETMKAFIQDNEDPDKAKAWAKDLGETFTAISEALPDNIPFISKMLKGYLMAPANYIKAFNNILDAYVAKIDLYAGSGDQEKAWISGKLMFIGSLALTYHLAPSDLQEFMFTHKNVGGVNLEKVHKVLGMSHLMNLIQRSYVPGGEGGPSSVTLEQKTRWIEFLGRQM